VAIIDSSNTVLPGFRYCARFSLKSTRYPITGNHVPTPFPYRCRSKGTDAEGASVRDAISDLEPSICDAVCLADALKEVATSTTASRETLSYLTFELADKVSSV
jgi:hypothetical protein